MNNPAKLTPEDFKEEFDLKKWIDEHSCIEEKGVITEKTSPGVISCLECNKALIFIKLEKEEENYKLNILDFVENLRGNLKDE